MVKAHKGGKKGNIKCKPKEATLNKVKEFVRNWCKILPSFVGL
jgi:glutamate dehydrogenase/leucine dehydrogenase